MSRRKRSRSGRRRKALVALAAALIEVLPMRLKGYRLGRDVVVRCRSGHLFTTIWIPFVSLKALRLGAWRCQRCPVGTHWSLVRPVKESELSDDELAAARARRDIRLP